jgi:hypothetical protein
MHIHELANRHRMTEIPHIGESTPVSCAGTLADILADLV